MIKISRASTVLVIATIISCIHYTIATRSEAENRVIEIGAIETLVEGILKFFRKGVI